MEALCVVAKEGISPFRQTNVKCGKREGEGKDDMQQILLYFLHCFLKARCGTET